MSEGNVFSTLIDIFMTFDDNYMDSKTFFENNHLYMLRGFIENIKLNICNFLLKDIKDDCICVKDVSQNDAVGFLILEGEALPGVGVDDYKFIEEMVYDDAKIIHLFILIHPMAVDDDTEYIFNENDEGFYNFTSPSKKDFRSIWMVDIIDRCFSYYINTIELSRYRMVTLTNNAGYCENTMLVLFKALAIRLSIYGRYILPNYTDDIEEFSKSENITRYDALISDRINLDWLKLSEYNSEKKVEFFSRQIMLKTQLYKWLDDIYKSITFIHDVNKPYLNDVYNKLIQLFVYGKVYDTIKPYNELSNFLAVGPIMYSTKVINQQWKKYLEGETT